MSAQWTRVIACLQQALVLTDEQANSITIETGSWELPEWDSLAHMRLLATLESEFGIEITEEHVAELTSVGAILAAVPDGDGASSTTVTATISPRQ